MKKSKRPKPLRAYFISLAILAVWIWGLNLLFSHFTSTDYFAWYLKNGSFISLGTAFFALVWKKLEDHKGLLAWHPAEFMGSCMVLAGVFFSAIATNLGGPLDGVKKRKYDAVTVIEVLWDGFMAIFMGLLMALAVLGWVIFVAPLYYVLTLITGATARREMRGTGRRLLVRKDGAKTVVEEQPATQPVPEGAVDVSFGTSPFALTNALNAAVLLVIKLLV